MSETDELGGLQFLEVRSTLPDELLMYADKTPAWVAIRSSGSMTLPMVTFSTAVQEPPPSDLRSRTPGGPQPLPRRAPRGEREHVVAQDGQGEDRASRFGGADPMATAVGGLPQPVTEHETVPGRREPDPPHRGRGGQPGLAHGLGRGGQAEPALPAVQGADDRRARRVRARRGAEHERLIRRYERDRRRGEPGGHRTARWRRAR